MSNGIFDYRPDCVPRAGLAAVRQCPIASRCAIQAQVIAVSSHKGAHGTSTTQSSRGAPTGLLSNAARSRSRRLPTRSHVRNDIVTELGTFQFLRAFHHAHKIIGHAPRRNRPAQSLRTRSGPLRYPAQVAEHHFPAQHHAAWIDLILVGVFRRRAVGGFKDGMARDVIDVAPRRDADVSPDLAPRRASER